MTKDLYGKWNPRARESAIFAVGIAGLVNELWFQAEARSPVLAFLLVLLGIPVVEKLDRLRQDRDQR